MKGGVFVGPLPKGSKELSRSSAIQKKKAELEKDALEEHRDEKDKQVYDDLVYVVNTAEPETFATFARGNAIALFTKENLQYLLKLEMVEGKQKVVLRDPFTKQEVHEEVLAWVTKINDKGPFKLALIMPVEHHVIKLTANANYLALVDRQGTFTIYNKYIEEEVALKAPFHNSVFITEDGKHAITYNYVWTSIPIGTANEKVLPKLWTITPEEVKSKDLTSPLDPAVKGAFITPDNKFYLYTTSYTFIRRSLNMRNALTRAVAVTQEELYRPDSYRMNIHYTNNKLIYYNPTQYFISYVQRAEDNTFYVLCENTSYVDSKYAGNYKYISPTAFSLDGTLMVSYTRPLAKIHIFDITQTKPTLLKKFSPQIINYQETELAFSTDNKYLFVAYSNLILVYNIVATPILVQQIQVGEKKERTIYSPDGNPPIHLAYFNGFVVAAIGKLVYFFEENKE